MTPLGLLTGGYLWATEVKEYIFWGDMHEPKLSGDSKILNKILKEEINTIVKEQNKELKEQNKELKEQNKEQINELKKQNKEQIDELKEQIKEQMKQILDAVAGKWVCHLEVLPSLLMKFIASSDFHIVTHD
eukprot:scaffold2825_cov145-Chaetoceros_neogracile.AAC.1